MDPAHPGGRRESEGQALVTEVAENERQAKLEAMYVTLVMILLRIMRPSGGYADMCQMEVRTTVMVLPVER